MLRDMVIADTCVQKHLILYLFSLEILLWSFSHLVLSLKNRYVVLLEGHIQVTNAIKHEQ